MNGKSLVINMRRRTKLLRTIALIVILTFVFQCNIFLYSKDEDELDIQFRKAQYEYFNGQYVILKNRLERLISIINEDSLDRKAILGKCYLLLGAVYEKEEKSLLAEENYRKAKDVYGIQAIDGVDLESLKIYRKVVKGERPITVRTIDNLFREARNEYNNGQYDISKTRLERIIGIIKKENLEVEKKTFWANAIFCLALYMKKKKMDALLKRITAGPL